MVLPSPADLSQFDLSVLRRAIAIYLARAYPDSEPPEVVRRRLDWPEGLDLATLLGRPPFEQVNQPEPDTPAILALRLGNARYPHMKLQIQPWPHSSGYLLSVNTHDQVLALNPNSRDFEAFRALQAENQRLKESIEKAWDEAGIPTFLRYLRTYIDQQGASAGDGPEPAS